MFFAFATNIIGQATNNDKYIADKYFNHKRYAEALPYYLNLLKADTTNGEINFRTGVCYWNSRSQKIKAIPYLEKAISVQPEQTGKYLINAYKILGDSFYKLYNFDDAILYYEEYGKLLTDEKGGNEALLEVGLQIEVCKMGRSLEGLLSSAEVKKSNNNYINNKRLYNLYDGEFKNRSDFAFPFKPLHNNYSRINENRYFENIIRVKVDSLRSHDIVIAPDKKINKYETTIATSVDGQIILTYRDEEGSAVLYTSSLKGNYWTLPEKINKMANSGGWEPDEYISADGTMMYFTSDKKEGYGGKDIYKCEKLGNSEWGKAINLGPLINTPYDEEAPLIHPDGKTFYFSSNGYNKEGNFEILNCIIPEDGNPSLPIKVGFPINAESSAKVLIQELPEQITKLNNVKTNSDELVDKRDNYIISFNNPNGVALTLIKGKFVEKAGVSAEPVKIEIKNNENESISGCYFANASHGFAVILPSTINNNISFEKNGFLIQSVNMDISENRNYYKKLNPIVLIPIESDARILLNNVFFEPGRSTIRSISKTELNNWVRFMNNNPDINIEVIGIMECRSKIRENSKLCSEQTEALVEYFSEKGIRKERLNAKGYAMKLKKSDISSAGPKIELRIIQGESGKVKTLSTQ